MEAERAKRIKELQKEKDVVILAHYYVDGAVQEIADYVGDSFYLSKVATKVPQPDGTYDYGRPDRGSERGIRRSGSGLLCELHGGD